MASRSPGTRPDAVTVGRAVLLAALVAVVLFYVLGLLAVEGVWTVLGLGLVAVLVLVLSPADLTTFLGRVQKLSVGPVSAELQAAAKSAAASADVDREDESGRGEAGDLVDLRLKLQAKITYLAKHVLCSPGVAPSDATFVTVGSMHHDGYLTHDEARTADAILTASSLDTVSETMSRSREDFFASASEFVKGFRATVFHALVMGLIEKADPRVEEVRRPGAKRADIRTNALGTTVRVVPVFAQSSSSGLVAKQFERQATQDDPLVVVLPLNTPGTESDRRQGVLTLHDLRAQLRHP